MDCGVYRTFFQYVLERDRDAHKFALRNGLKDVTYLASLANASGAANPLGAAVRISFALAVGSGHGDDCVPMLSDIVARLNGISLTDPPPALAPATPASPPGPPAEMETR